MHELALHYDTTKDWKEMRNITNENAYEKSA